MDVLAGVDLGTMKTLTWFFAFVAGGLWALRVPHEQYWEKVTAVFQGLLVAIVAFSLLNFGVAGYIHSNLTDPRWSEGKEPWLTATEIQSSIPIIGDVVKSLSDTQHRVVGAVNEIGRMKNSFDVAGGFMRTAGESIIALILIAFTVWPFVRKWAMTQEAKYRQRQESAKLEALQKQSKDNEYRDREIGMLYDHLKIDRPSREE